jgi:RND family efflux transporter MFP subunit
LGAGSSGLSDANSATDSAETIASDQAAIDDDQATLINAEQSLSDATLTSPITGTVASVGLSVGETVSANSSTEVIEIIGQQSYEVTGSLTGAQVTQAKVGSPATVSIDGIAKSISGTVSQVGPVQSTSSGYSYPLVVALPASSTGLFSGSTATVAITTSEAENVVAVPTSAVNTVGTRSYVVVLKAGTPTDKVVKVGIVGGVYTQIVSGLSDGSSVMLADLAEPVPSSNATTTFGGGGFGGGGFGGVGGAGTFVRRSAVGGGGAGAGGFG